MSVYKNKTGKGWFTKFRYYDWQGKMVYVTKRGFETKRDAQKYEIDFKAKSLEAHPWALQALQSFILKVLLRELRKAH